jgi:hypothetical protein
MKKSLFNILATVALTVAVVFSASAQDTSDELIRQIRSMGAAKVEYLYKVAAPSHPSVEMTGFAEIQDDMWKDINSDGSEFYCDGTNLWYKFTGEVTITKVNSNDDDPAHNITGFIRKSTLSKAGNGNRLLTVKEKDGTVMTLEIKSLKKVPLKEKTYYVLDVKRLGDDYYVTDLRK